MTPQRTSLEGGIFSRFGMATALAPPPTVGAASANNGDNIGEAEQNDASVPSNISVVSTSKEEGLEKAAESADTKEYDYPDGGLRGKSCFA